MTVHDLADTRLFDAQHCRQQAHRPVQILGVLAHDGDAIGVAILDEHDAVAIEHDAAWRAQRERALMVVLGHLLELRVLHDLEYPEAHRKEGKQRGDGVLSHTQPDPDAPPFLVEGHIS
jgi:hypothetical protein